MLESKPALLFVVALLLTDLSCTVTACLHPGHELLELVERVGFGCLVAFFVEQCLHLAAFGIAGFFSNPWSATSDRQASARRVALSTDGGALAGSCWTCSL